MLPVANGGNVLLLRQGKTISFSRPLFPPTKLDPLRPYPQILCSHHSNACVLRQVLKFSVWQQIQLFDQFDLDLLTSSLLKTTFF